MTHSKIKLSTKEIPAFRKFLEARGFKCRDGKGEWQSLQVQNITDRGWKAFCDNAKGVVTSPVEFDALIQVFRALVDPVRICTVAEACRGQEGPIATPAKYIADQLQKEKLKSIQHDSDLLDDFAIAAMQGMLSGGGVVRWQLAEYAYSIALDMMAERANHQPK